MIKYKLYTIIRNALTVSSSEYIKNDVAYLTDGGS